MKSQLSHPQTQPKKGQKKRNDPSNTPPLMVSSVSSHSFFDAGQTFCRVCVRASHCSPAGCSACASSVQHNMTSSQFPPPRPGPGGRVAKRTTDQASATAIPDTAVCHRFIQSPTTRGRRPPLSHPATDDGPRPTPDRAPALRPAVSRRAREPAPATDLGICPAAESYFRDWTGWIAQSERVASGSPQCLL